jgi:peptidoglycan/LPS O-acetylase OafA/YrhL
VPSTLRALAPADDARIDRALRRTMPSLDGLRGLAIGGVLASHFLNAWPLASPADRAFIAVIGLGWSGVDLFFVLSGFLITGILVDTLGAANWWRAFLARRTLRIFPLYYLALAVFWWAGPLAGLIDVWTLRRWGWWYWSYLSNWAFAARQTIPSLSHFWSLAVEEQFYLFWPLVVWLARGRRLALAAAALFAAGPLVRFLIVDASGWPVGSAYRVTPGRVDQLALGALLAVLFRSVAGRAWLNRWWRPVAAAGALAFVALGLPLGPFDMHRAPMEIWSHTLLGLAYGGLLAGAVAGEGSGGGLQRFLGAAPLQVLGRYSYGLYVVHYFVHEAAVAALRGWPPGAAVLSTRGGVMAYAGAATAVSLALAWLSWHLFEKRFLTLKSFFVARPPATAVAAASPAGACYGGPP